MYSISVGKCWWNPWNSTFVFEDFISKSSTILNAFEEIVTTGSEGNIFIRLANYLTYLNKTSAGLDPKNQQQVRKILKDLGGLRWRNLDHTNISFIQIRLIALLQVMQRVQQRYQN